MIRVQDFGEMVYGGAVTLTEWWDKKRVDEGKIEKKEVLKKAGFYTYAVIGIFATLASAFGWWKRREKWMEHVSHGFLYDFPRFIYNVVDALREPSAAGGSNEALAVRQAKEVLRRRQQEIAGKETRALHQGAADVTPGEIPITEDMEILA